MQKCYTQSAYEESSYKTTLNFIYFSRKKVFLLENEIKCVVRQYLNLGEYGPDSPAESSRYVHDPFGWLLGLTGLADAMVGSVGRRFD